MSATDDELELDVLEDEQPETPEGEAPEGAEKPEGEKPDERLEAMQRQIAELTGKQSVSAELAPLLDVAKQFFATQGAPKPGASDPSPEAIAAFGKKLQEAFVTGDPTDVAMLFSRSVDGIVKQRVDEALTTHGQPLAERAGDSAYRQFLADKREGSGASENASKLHGLITKEIALEPNERRWLATASVADANRFLETKWEQAAGRVLIKSSTKAKAPNLGGGSGSGRGGKSNVTSFPGVDARSQSGLDQLAEAYWPDPKVREAKMKQLRESMTETGT